MRFTARYVSSSSYTQGLPLLKSTICAVEFGLYRVCLRNERTGYKRPFSKKKRVSLFYPTFSLY